MKVYMENKENKNEISAIIDAALKHLNEQLLILENGDFNSKWQELVKNDIIRFLRRAAGMKKLCSMTTALCVSDEDLATLTEYTNYNAALSVNVYYENSKK